MFQAKPDQIEASEGLNLTMTHLKYQLPYARIISTNFMVDIVPGGSSLSFIYHRLFRRYYDQ